MMILNEFWLKYEFKETFQTPIAPTEVKIYNNGTQKSPKVGLSIMAFEKENLYQDFVVKEINVFNIQQTVGYDSLEATRYILRRTVLPKLNFKFLNAGPVYVTFTIRYNVHLIHPLLHTENYHTPLSQTMEYRFEKFLRTC